MSEKDGIDVKELLEEIKRRNARKNEIFNSTKEYGEETLRMIEQFADGLLIMYPGAFDRDKIITRIKANLNDDITFTSHVREIDENANGFFHTEDKNIEIYDRLSELDSCSSCFHELFHTLVEKNDMDLFDDESREAYIEDIGDESYYLEDLGYANSRLMTEGIATIAQEDWERRVLNEKRERVNGYIPCYARQLRAVFGDELIIEFIKYYKNIRPLLKYFYAFDDKISMFNLAEYADSVDEYEKNGFKIDANYVSSIIEMTITVLLKNYLMLNKQLSDEEKINKIEALVKEQIAPNFDYLRSIIENEIKDKSLLANHPIANYIYTLSIDKTREDSKNNRDLKMLIMKYSEYYPKSLFGLSEPVFNQESRIYEYDQSKMKEYYNNKTHFRLFAEAYQDIKEQFKDASEITIEGNKTKKIDDESALRTRGTISFNEAFFLNNLITDRAILKASSNGGENSLYIIEDGNSEPEIRKPMDIEEAIKYYLEEQKEDEDTIGGYNLAIQKLDEIRMQGITTVYVGPYGFIADYEPTIGKYDITFGFGEAPNLDESVVELEKITDFKPKVVSRKNEM